MFFQLSSTNLNTNSNFVTALNVLPTKTENWNLLYGNGLYVAYGTNPNATDSSNVLQTSAAAWSTDLINWTQSNLSLAREWNGCIYAKGIFVIVGGYESLSGTYSYDGKNWNTFAMPLAQTWSRVTYGKDKFVAIAIPAGKFAYSYDGVNWKASNTLPTLTSIGYYRGLAFGNGIFVAISYFLTTTTDMVYSFDGISWIKGSMPIAAAWRGVVFGKDKFVAVGTNDTGQTIYNTNIAAYSYDGIIWNTITLPIKGTWSSIVYTNNGFFITDNTTNITIFSSDGINWPIENKINIPSIITWAGSPTVGSPIYDGQKLMFPPKMGSNTIVYLNDTNNFTINTISPTSNGTNNFTINIIPPIEYFIVGGGGSSSANITGGGGAGGLVNSTFDTQRGTTYTVLVGAGAAAPNISPHPAPGSNSSIVNTITAYGGGSSPYYTYYTNGLSGGSGSGGLAWNITTGANVTGGNGIQGQGNAGGSGWAVNGQGGGGGGGGAGGVGGNSTATIAGNGGIGSIIPYPLTSVGQLYNGNYYLAAGGGGGGVNTIVTAGTGGIGGGGNGGQSYGQIGYAGTVNTGSGGGGASGNSNSNGGAQGGSGVVILKIPTTYYSGNTTGSPTVSTFIDYTYLIYNSSGTYTA